MLTVFVHVKCACHSSKTSFSFLSLMSLFLILCFLFPHQVWPLAWATPINLLCILKKQKQQNASGKHINILIHHSASELQCQGMHTHTFTHTVQIESFLGNTKASVSSVFIYSVSVFVCICGHMQRAKCA